MTNNFLPSWNDTPTKKSIIDFIETITNETGPDFIPVTDRIATFDNDGTLWTEQPLQVELFFALDMAKKQAKLNPDL